MYMTLNYMNFTYKHYQKTCLQYIESGYKFLLLGQKNKKKKSIYMVHDCDFSLESALNLAIKEKEIEIKSTYFLRLGSKNYNILNPYYSDIVKKIIENGHDVGLHYENLFLKEEINYSIKLISKAIQHKIKYFNVHEPTRSGLDFSLNNSEYNRCYNSRFFKNFKYISDSGGRWREGCFSQHINKYNNLLVSTHPVWWYEESPRFNY